MPQRPPICCFAYAAGRSSLLLVTGAEAGVSVIARRAECAAIVFRLAAVARAKGPQARICSGVKGVIMINLPLEPLDGRIILGNPLPDGDVGTPHVRGSSSAKFPMIR